MQLARFYLTERGLKNSLDRLALDDPDIRAMLQSVGYPAERRRPAGFGTLVHIIVGQQVSTNVANTIVARLSAAVNPGLNPTGILKLSDEALRGVGLSRQKTRYIRNLAEAVAGGEFDIDGLAGLPEDEAVDEITRLLGFGRWSAEMYLLFSLGRRDVWPAGDLAVQEGVKRLKGLAERPGIKEMDEIGEAWRPDRSAAAIFMWHLYANPPL